MKRLLGIFLILAMICGLCACGNEKSQSTDPHTRTITDGMDRQVEIPEKVESVVCVGVGALRYTCYMQAQDKVVGIEDYEKKQTLYRLYNFVNFDTFKDLPVTGTNGDPFVEEIIKVGPDVILMSAAANMAPQELQEKSGIPVVVMPHNDTALGEPTYETFRILGELYGRQDRAKELTDYLKGLKTDLETRTAGAETKPTVYVGGVSYKGGHGFEGTEANYGPFTLIGADNLADRTGQTKAFNIDPEQVLEWDPDVIFLDYNGMELIREDYGRNPAYYESLTAMQEGKVYAQISFRHCAVNLDTMLADAYYAATVLYPEQFADVDAEEKAGEIFTMLLGSNPYEDLKEAGYEFKALTPGV